MRGLRKSWSVSLVVRVIVFAVCAMPHGPAKAYSEQSYSDKSALGFQALERGDTVAALRAFDAAFRAGDADAGFYLGRMVEQGLGLETDFAQALALYKEAAKRGSTRAMVRLGALSAEGTLVAGDLAKARDLFCLAAERGNSDGAYNCASLLWAGQGARENKKRALTLYRQAAAKGHGAANVLLGFWHQSGKAPFIKRDARKALAHFEHAASYGNPNALYELGRMFEAGRVLARNLERAQLYYMLSAMRGHRASEAAARRLGATLTKEQLEWIALSARMWKARAQPGPSHDAGGQQP